MKKIYAALAMALAASPAFAARVNTEAMPLNLPAEVSNFSKVAETRGDVMKELSITSVDQLCGPFMIVSSSGFDEDEHNVIVYIEKGA